jgi:hypothetical protein
MSQSLEFNRAVKAPALSKSDNQDDSPTAGQSQHMAVALPVPVLHEDGERETKGET